MRGDSLAKNGQEKEEHDQAEADEVEAVADQEALQVAAQLTVTARCRGQARLR